MINKFRDCLDLEPVPATSAAVRKAMLDFQKSFNSNQNCISSHSESVGEARSYFLAILDLSLKILSRNVEWWECPLFNKV